MKKFVGIGLFLLVCLTFFGCQKSDRREKGKPFVVVSIPPYLSIIEKIAGDTVSVSSALGMDFNPHNSEATPSQMRMVQDCDLFIGVGEGYEQKLLTAIQEGTKNVWILELDEKTPLLSNAQDTTFFNPCEGEGHFHQVAGKDLHFWLGPKSLVLQVMAITKMLGDLLPDNRALYQKNGELLVEDIKHLEEKLRVKLSPYKGKAIMVSHAALGYFCKDFDLKQVAVECEGKSPLPREVEQVIDFAKRHEILCLFTAPQFNNRGAELIAKDLGIRIEKFDPLASNPLNTIELLAHTIAQ